MYGLLKVAIFTVGCRANQADSAWLSRRLDPRRVRFVDFTEQADVYVVNSCAVTRAAERDVRKAISRARRNGGPEARILLAGCMVAASPEELEKLGILWRVVSAVERNEIPGMLHALQAEKSSAHEGAGRHPGSFSQIPDQLSRTRPSLRIQDGCRGHCTYCIVPVARGGERSTPLPEILTRLQVLADEGAHEVVICGVNLGRWGRDLTPKQGLADLIGELDVNAPLGRLRLSSVEPWAITEEFTEAFRKAGKFASHLHLPIQSGDDAVLRRMKRPYDVQRYRRVVSMLLAARPELSLGTDVIVGFPGESVESFDTTVTVLRELPFSYLHVFGFSARPGTPAALMENGVGIEEIKRRVSELRLIGAEKRKIFAARLVGEVVHPVFEAYDHVNQRARGTSGRFVNVRAVGPPELLGKCRPVVVTSSDEQGRVDGRLIELE